MTLILPSAETLYRQKIARAKAGDTDERRVLLAMFAKDPQRCHPIVAQYVAGLVGQVLKGADARQVFAHRRKTRPRRETGLTYHLVEYVKERETGADAIGIVARYLGESYEAVEQRYKRQRRRREPPDPDGWRDLARFYEHHRDRLTAYLALKNRRKKLRWQKVPG